MSRPLRAPVTLVVLAAGLGLVGRGAWIPTKAWLAQRLLERAWARTMATGAPARPWPWADTWPVARLEAPEHGEDVIVLAGGCGRTMAFGPGHLDASAAPGEAGNCVIAGHRDTHFAFLADLRVGDHVVVERADGRKVAYRVCDLAVVDRDDVWVAAGSAQRVLTLVTCYPFSSPLPGGRRRYVVWAVADESRQRG